MDSIRIKLIVCVPAFDEGGSIAGVLVQARKHVDRVVVCDDGSRDLTGAVAEGLGAVVVRHEWNMGYGAALRSLFSESLRLGADIVVTLDADGQHNADDKHVCYFDRFECDHRGLDVDDPSHHTMGYDERGP